MRALIERTMQGDVFDADLLAEAEQVQGFRNSLCAHLHAHPEIFQGKSSIALLGCVNRSSAAVDLSPFWLLSFEDVLAVTDTITGGKEGFNLFLPDLEDLTASNLRRLMSNSLIHGLRVGEHNIGDLGQFLTVIDGTNVTSFNIPDLYSRGFAQLDDTTTHEEANIEFFTGQDALARTTPMYAPT